MFIKLVRLGKDSELRYTQGGKAVLQFTAAYDVGWGDKKKAQWISVSYWRQGNDNLQQYLKKGCRALIECDEIAVEEWTAKDGAVKSTLKAQATNIQLIDKVESQQPQQAQSEPAQDFADDIPF